jgi:TPP-dependent pyruvate/acetoin dehydrogenase alpha subunit
MMDAGLATGLYRTVLPIRRAEERIRDLDAAGRMPGFIHLSIGQVIATARMVQLALAAAVTLAADGIEVVRTTLTLQRAWAVSGGMSSNANRSDQGRCWRGRGRRAGR